MCLFTVTGVENSKCVENEPEKTLDFLTAMSYSAITTVLLGFSSHNWVSIQYMGRIMTPFFYHILHLEYKVRRRKWSTYLRRWNLLPALTRTNVHILDINIFRSFRIITKVLHNQNLVRIFYWISSILEGQ